MEGTADPTGENGGQDQAPATEAPGTGEPPGDAPPSSAKPRARPRSHPVAPEPPPSPTEDECTQVLTRARVAFASYRWPAVLAHTRDGSCWSEHEAEYLMIRTEALMEEGRWAECVRTGRRSSDPIVRRHAERCQKRLATITGTP